MQVNKISGTENFGHWVGHHKDYLVHNLCVLMQKGKYKDAAEAVRIINKLEETPKFICSYYSRSLNLNPRIVMESARNPKSVSGQTLSAGRVCESEIGFFRSFVRALKKIEKIFDKFEPKNSPKSGAADISGIKELIPHVKKTSGDVDFSDPLYKGLSKLIKIDTSRYY